MEGESGRAGERRAGVGNTITFERSERRVYKIDDYGDYFESLLN